MEDTWKVLGGLLFGFLTIQASLEPRARRAAERQFEESFRYTGQVRARVEPRGMFGMLSNDLWSVDFYGRGVRTDELPFRLYPREGWKGSIRHLRLHLTDFELKGLPIRRFYADIPFVKYDLGHALYKNRLHFRAAGEGPAEVEVGTDGLKAFVLGKYRDTLSDVEVVITAQKINLSGKYRLIADPSPFQATGRLQIREGRYVDLIDPEITVGGIPLTRRNAERLLQRLNPILDVETDLGLKGFFRMTEVLLGDNRITIRGRMTVPLHFIPFKPSRKF